MNNINNLEHNNTMINKAIEALQAMDTPESREILAIYKDSDYVTGTQHMGGNGLSSTLLVDTSDTMLLEGTKHLNSDWLTVKAKETASATYDSYEDSDITAQEHSELCTVVNEHQTSLEGNNNYNVRQLAHWKQGFDSTKANKAHSLHVKHTKDAWKQGYSIDMRHTVGTTKAERIALKLEAIAIKEAKREARKAKKA